MHNLKISVEDALAIAAADEGHFLDKKALEISGKGVQKTAVGFANSDEKGSSPLLTYLNSNDRKRHYATTT